tara:strand:+ start:53 stop:388 length:336 start_codon:yes stop_codon:yes gene_type:complete
VGERKCAFEGCNALEFRTTGYCLRHKDANPDKKAIPIPKDGPERPISIKGVFGFILMIFGIPISITGAVWFMDDTYVVSQMAGIILLMFGVPASVVGYALTHELWFGSNEA